tara:strand:+ start:4871 stop:5254 length:384 start_codon:yes stop_codon:yes gene_type:complete
MFKMTHPATVVPAVQFIVAIIGTLIGFLTSTLAVAYSILVGCFVAIIPQIIFSWWVFRVRGARNARTIAQNLFVGEGLKLSTTVALFALLWSFIGTLVGGAVIAGFAAAILVGQFSLPFILNGRTKL